MLQANEGGVEGDLAVPSAGLGVLAQRVGVGELGFQLGQELGSDGEVVALLADFGVGAGLGGQVSGAVAVRRS